MVAAGLKVADEGKPQVLGPVKCPRCRAEVVWDGNPFRPFCSDRCRDLDLGAWLNEEYRIPGEDEDVASDAKAKTSDEASLKPDDDG